MCRSRISSRAAAGSARGLQRIVTRQGMGGGRGPIFHVKGKAFDDLFVAFILFADGQAASAADNVILRDLRDDLMKELQPQLLDATFHAR